MVFVFAPPGNAELQFGSLLNVLKPVWRPAFLSNIAAEIEEGRREFKEGKLKMTTLENLMQEIFKS